MKTKDLLLVAAMLPMCVNAQELYYGKKGIYGHFKEDYYMTTMKHIQFLSMSQNEDTLLFLAYDRKPNEASVNEYDIVVMSGDDADPINKNNEDLLEMIAKKRLKKIPSVKDECRRLLKKEKDSLIALIDKCTREIRTSYPYGKLNVCLEINSAGGVIPSVSYMNTSKKTIKYITFYFKFFNAVNDRCYIKYGSSSFKGIGPIEPMKKAYYGDEVLGYDSTVESCTVYKIVIEYFDKTRKVYYESQIAKM